VRTFTVVAMAACGMLLFGAASANAATPGRDGLITYVNNGNIWVMHDNGSGKHRISRDGTEPRWSPDGRRIAFTRHADIWVMHANGSHQQQLTTGEAFDGSPSWSPRGRWVLFQSDREDPGDGDYGIYKIRSRRPLGPIVTVIPKVDFEDALRPTYAANGRFTYLLDQDDEDFGNCCDIQNVVGGVETNLTFCLCIGKIDWSPSSRELAYGNLHYDVSIDDFTASQIFVISADGTRVHRLTHGRTNYYDENVSWAPAGRWLVFDEAFELNDATTSIWKIRADGTHRVRLARVGMQPDWQSLPAS
jgi:tricorn protease-like protein